MKLTLTDLGGNYVFNPSAKTITISWVSPTISTNNLLLINNTTTNTIIYQFNNPALGGSISSNIISLTYDTTSMSSWDNLIIFFDLPAPAYDLSTNSNLTSTLNNLNNFTVNETILNAVNIAAWTNLYPSATGMSMDWFKDLCVSWVLIDADNTTTLTVEVTNNPDPSVAVWHPIYWQNVEANALVNSVAASSSTTNFVRKFDEANYQWVRFKLVTWDSTNTARIFIRRKAL
jgi:hypothetical protein